MIYKKRGESLKKIALFLMAAGSVNWGIIGVFGYDVISAFFGPDLEICTRILFTLISASGLYIVFLKIKEGGM